MCGILCPAAGDRLTGGRRLAFWLLTFLAVPGCSRPEAAENPPGPPTVRLIHPQRRTIRREVGQPSFVESYERTSIYPKVTGYVEKWNVDIGDPVKKGTVLATLFVPELREDWQTKKDKVKLDEERVSLALEVVQVAEADVEAADARLDEAKEILGKFQSQVDRWDSEVKRLKREVDRGVVDPQVLLESQNQLKSSTAARDAARATIARAKAELSSAKATLAKDKVDVAVARADLAVARSDARRLEAWVGYLTLSAPYDGVIVARNANTGDFVLPASGDLTAMQRAPDLAPTKAAPVYVVDRTDIIRVFVDVPERDADSIRSLKTQLQGDALYRWLVERERERQAGKTSDRKEEGNQAFVQIKAYRDEWLPGTVTRTSWALNVKSRTLRVEIDLLNPGGKILPGMYAYGKVIVEHPDVWALPLAALAYSGNGTYYWRCEDGKSVRTEIETGIDDGEWIEVLRQRPSSTTGRKARWAPITGSEQVILGDLSDLDEDEAVQVTQEGKEEIARAAKSE